MKISVLGESIGTVEGLLKESLGKVQRSGKCCKLVETVATSGSTVLVFGRDRDWKGNSSLELFMIAAAAKIGPL